MQTCIFSYIYCFRYHPLYQTKAFDAPNFKPKATWAKPAPTPNNGPIFSPAIVNKLKRYSKPNNLPWSPYMDAVDEEMVLRDGPLADVDDAACIENSKIFVIGKQVVSV